jgi:double-stranded uracil-DNA glycosylase
MPSLVIRSFEPIAAPNARLLILGSMPGVASLEAGQYYAHPHNAFWRIMGDLVGAGPEKSYDERTRILRDRGIAVWDVLKSCVRQGSLDADIRDEVANDLPAFLAAHPGIVRIGLNGGKAAASFKMHAARYCPPGVTVVKLPSTSPAHAARTFAEKCEMWRAGLGLDKGS